MWQHEISAAIAAVTKSVETVLCPIPATPDLRGATLYRVRCPASKLTTSWAFHSDCITELVDVLAELLYCSNPRARVSRINQQHPGVMQQPGP